MLKRTQTGRMAVLAATVFILALGSCSDKQAGNIADDKGAQTGANIAEIYTLITPELGGEGFEQLADSLGFVNTTISTEELNMLTSPQAKKGGEINIVIPRFLLSFRPFFVGKNANFSENQLLSRFCFERLVTINPVSLEIMPELASHWKISDDKRVFTFRINPRARFSDGSEVTSRDVVATWRLAVDPDLQSPSLKLIYDRFKEPVPLGKYMVQVESTELNWQAFLSFGSSMDILSANEIEQLTAKEFLDNYTFKQPIGSGPYVIKPEDIAKQKSYSLTRRADYWNWDDRFYQRSRNFDKINFEIVKDNRSLEYEKFKKGEQDFFYYTSATMEQWVKDNDWNGVTNGLIKKIRVQTQGPAGSWGFAMNMRKPPFDDIRIRKAFCYLNNRAAFIERALYNEYEPLDSYYGNSPYENPDNPKVRYNPELAKKLLAEAGWTKKNQEGILVKDGQPFTVEFAIDKGSERFVTPFQAELRKAGIDLQIKFQDQNTLTQMAHERKFLLHHVNFGGLVFPNPETQLRSDLADQENNNNLEGFKDPYVDSLLKVYLVTFDVKKRIEIIRTIDKIMMDSFKKVKLFTPKGIKIAYWDKFGRPDAAFSRFTQPGDWTDEVLYWWWYEPDKAARVAEAMKNNTKLGNFEGIKTISFWRDYKDNPSAQALSTDAGK